MSQLIDFNKARKERKEERKSQEIKQKQESNKCDFEPGQGEVVEMHSFDADKYGVTDDVLNIPENSLPFLPGLAVLYEDTEGYQIPCMVVDAGVVIAMVDFRYGTPIKTIPYNQEIVNDKERALMELAGSLEGVCICPLEKSVTPVDVKEFFENMLKHFNEELDNTEE